MMSLGGTELQFSVVIQKDHSSAVSGVVAFGDFVDSGGSSAIYPVGAIYQFYSDLVLGRPFPLKFVTRGVTDPQTLIAICLFLRRDLALHPRARELVSAADWVRELGISGSAHVSEDLAGLLRLLTGLLAKPNMLEAALGMVERYILLGEFPALPQVIEPVIRHTGTNGFVVAESSGDPYLAWEQLYRAGYLRGVLFGQFPLVARKSPYLSFDLERVRRSLLGVEPWHVEEGLWLRGPVDSKVPGDMLVSLLLQA